VCLGKIFSTLNLNRNFYILITRSLKLFDEAIFAPPNMCARHGTSCSPSNLVPNTGYFIYSLDFSQFFQPNSGIIPEMRPRQHASTFISINYLLIIQQFSPIYSELQTASSDK
jgi:hypothetical protein